MNTKRVLLICYLLCFCIQCKKEQMFFGDIGIPEDYSQTQKSYFPEVMSMKFNQRIEVKIPERLNLCEDFLVPSQKDQLEGCQSCWSFVAAAVMESKIKRLTGSDHFLDLSEQQQISCNREMHGCQGGSLRSFNYWKSHPPILDECGRYCACEGGCDSFSNCNPLPYRVEEVITINTEIEEDVKLSLMLDGPAYFRFDVYDDFVDYWNGNSQVYVNQGDKRLNFGHAVLLIGWDDSKKAWLCQNSWGSSSGPLKNGQFWMAYEGHRNYLHFGMANIKIEPL